MRLSSIARVLAIVAVLMVTSRALAEQPFSYLSSGDLVISKATDANDYLAYSKQSGAWKRHAFAEGIKAIPVVSGSLCVFALSGERITELVGVDVQGNWRTAKLSSPATECKPIVSDSVAVVNHAGRSYAFSSITGTWDSIPTVGTPFLDQDMVLIKTDDSIAAFSAQTGKWAEASLKSRPE